MTLVKKNESEIQKTEVQDTVKAGDLGDRHL